MHALYTLSVVLHVLAATSWIGGILFLVLVVVPWLRKGNQAQGAVFLQQTGERFRAVSWAGFGVLIVTGTFNLWYRGVRFPNLVDGAWLRSPFGSAVAWKLAIFVAILAVSAVHDFSVGPAATAAAMDGADPERAQRLRRRASLMGRAIGLLGIVVVTLAVILVRGWP